MNDYESLDLSPVCNAGANALGEGRTPVIGDQTLRGLPFKIGQAESSCFVVSGDAPVAISVEKEAEWVIFAHVMLGSRLHDGDPVGRVAGSYRFVMADGEKIEVPIRERFEIGAVPVGWGELPFLAVPDHPDSLPDRYEGAWAATGFRQTEVRQQWPQDYYLWAWRNPRPDVRIERIEIVGVTDDGGRLTEGDGPESVIRHPTSVQLLVAAITLSHLEEEPFHRSAAVPVKLTVADPPPLKDARLELTVQVDRGVTTFPYSLPEKGAEAFLADSRPGMGEAQNETGSPSYVEIAATPSATVTVNHKEEALGSVRWGELEEKRVVETERIRFEVVDTGRNWVHTTVVDDATGKPIPCRIHFRSPHGVPYAPHGHHPHVNRNLGSWHQDVGGDVRLGQITYAYIDGKCQGWMPRGEVIVDAARGYEYEPLRTKVEIRPGQRELELRLRRKENLNAERWFSGDTHVHFLSTQGAITEAAAEDLDVVNLLMSQWGHLFTNTEEFIGRPVRSGDGETIVYATQENRQHLLGHLTLLGLKEMVMPWCSDGPSEAEMGGNLEVMMSHWADACHAQGGTVVIPHLPNPNGEPAALIATGRADAVEFLVHNPFFHLEYYRYLNGGYRLPLAGGTDKMDSGVPVGLYRTYAWIPPDEEFNYDNWCKALRSGRTFLSGGPLLRFTVDGQPIGSTITLGRDGGTVEIEAVATSVVPIHSLQIVRGTAPDACGANQFEIVAGTEDSNGAKELRVRAQVTVDRSTWLCARCAGPGYDTVKHHDTWKRGIMAHTSPVYVACERYDVISPATMEYMLTLLDGSLQHIRTRAPQWRPGTTTHHHGDPDHQAFLERPLHQAIAAVHKKMHEHGIPH